jgi:deoxyribodipyrimidine photo-lyase
MHVSSAGLPKWARTTLQEHRSDTRPALYSRQQLERGETADELWSVGSSCNYTVALANACE